MTYRTEWEDDALVSLERLDTIVRTRILEKTAWLAANYEAVRHMGLRGRLRGYFKLVLGDYRVVYRANRSEKVLVIHDVGHRSSIYKEE